SARRERSFVVDIPAAIDRSYAAVKRLGSALGSIPAVAARWAVREVDTWQAMHSTGCAVASIGVCAGVSAPRAAMRCVWVAAPTGGSAMAVVGPAGVSAIGMTS